MYPESDLNGQAGDILEPEEPRMKLKLYYAGATNYFYKYESEQEETFKSKKGIVAKVWISKDDMITRDENGQVISLGYPQEIEITVGQVAPSYADVMQDQVPERE